MDPLDQAARDLIARYKHALGPSPEHTAMNWQAIAAQAEAESDIEERRRAARRAFGLRALVATVAAAAAIVLVVSPWRGHSDGGDDALPSAQYEHKGGDATGGAAIDREPAPQPEATKRRRRSVGDAERGPAVDPEMDSALEPARDPAAQSEDAIAIADADAGADVGVPSPPRARKPSPAPVDPLVAVREEADLVGRARTALASGRAGDALSLAREHARRFEDGALAEEMATIRVGALCEVGPAARWRKALRSFERRYPHSPLRVHLDDDCFE